MINIEHTEDEIIFGDNIILFDEPSHTYTTPEGHKFTSVTTVIGKYETPFNRDYWLKVKAKERGITVEMLAEEWDKTNQEACERGNLIHNLLEDNIREGYKKLKNPTQGTFSLDKNNAISSVNQLHRKPNFKIIYNLYPEIFNYLISLLERGYILYAENRICLIDFLIAGTIDLLAVKADYSDFIIVDWKTNKKPLYFKSGYISKRTGKWVDKVQFFKEPLNFIPECKGMLYSLQLSTYAYMVEQYGLNCKGLALFHMLPDPITNKETVKSYRIPYHRKAVHNMLVHHKNTYAA